MTLLFLTQAPPPELTNWNKDKLKIIKLFFPSNLLNIVKKYRMSGNPVYLIANAITELNEYPY